MFSSTDFAFAADSFLGREVEAGGVKFARSGDGRDGVLDADIVSAVPC